MAGRARGIVPFDTAALFTSLSQRVKDLEQRRNGDRGAGDTATITGSGSGRAPFYFTFHFVGSLSAAVSDPWPIPWTGRLWVARIKPSTPTTSGTTTLKIYKGGSALTPVGAGSTTITLTSGSSAERTVTFDDLYVRNPDGTADAPKVEIVSPGTGASGLAVTLCWM